MRFGIYTNSLSIKTYGNLNHQVRFDRQSMQQKEMDSFGKILMKTHYFNSGETRELSVYKIYSDYYVVIHTEKRITVPNAQEDVKKIQSELQALLPKNKIICSFTKDPLIPAIAK